MFLKNAALGLRLSARFPSRTSDSISALRNTLCGVKYRSLPSDDPFGERSSWEDPGDGIFAGWKDIPQEQFAAAADSDKVRQAHFGPEWARFSTVGKMSIQQATQNPNAPVASAEEVNSKNVAAKRAMLEKNNFATYEEYLENHLSGEGEVPEDVIGGEETSHFSASPFSTSAVGMDESLQPSRTAAASGHEEEESDDTSFEPPPTLPKFITNPETIETPASGSTVAEAARHSSSTAAPRLNLKGIPSSFLQSVYARLPIHVSHDSIPIGDPLTWNTEEIIQFLSHLVPKDADGVSVMDETMISTFEMAAVTGAMLLNTVTPPRLFSLMRRWHVARQRIAIQVWAEYRKPLQGSSEKDDAAEKKATLPSFDKIEEIIKDGIPQLESIVTGLSPELVQETILLCFPYGYGKSG